ncbi:MAG: dihydropyrimidine dehydrogenase, partial [Candidatus Aminicenantes bacterium]|nr:dihydropyrimidine dehydrogenase [Candidatus Aminicenantes bacterium]
MSEKRECPPELKARLRAEFEKDWRKDMRRAIPVKERMKIHREHMPEREPGERNKAFVEVNRGLEAEAAVREAQRCLDCANPECVLGCPVAIDIPSFVKLVEKQDFAASVRKIRETNSLPAVCGRVCPQETQCEELCNLK